MDFELNDFRKALPKIKDVQTFIMDPPYNIKFDYQSKYKDNLDPEEYKQTIKEVLDIAYNVSKDSASFFMINYPEVTAELYSTIKDTQWNTHQWITWVYNSNFGFSSKRFTKASLSNSSGSPTTVYSAASNKTSIIIGCLLVNKTTSDVTVHVYNDRIDDFCRIP